ncbi:MAG: ABC transporter permease [Candidatus Caldarchaeum sp.]
MVEQKQLTSSELKTTFKTILKSRTASFGLFFVISLIVVAVLAPVISPFDPNKQELIRRLEGPSQTNLLGLDEFGRDILSRIIHGARVSLQVGLGVVLLAMLIGTVVGLVAGYYGGVIDLVLMRITEVFLAFPGLVLSIGIMAVIGPGIANIVLALATVYWPQYARVIRSQVLTIKNMDFLLAAKTIGSSDMRLLLKHILPNSVPPVIVLTTLGIGAAILAEAGLSFLGLGVNPPTPSWGSMIASGRDYILQAPHLLVFPGLVITITVLAFNLLGDGLRDALDPRLKV